MATNSTAPRPVFLSANSRCMSLIRQAFSAHPGFFTSHLPCDDQAALCEWARAMSTVSSSRRPVWLSDVAVECVEALRQELPEARFIRVCEAPGANDSDCLEISAFALLTNPLRELSRMFEYVGVSERNQSSAA